MAESEAFKEKKKIGRWFEGEVDKVLISKGMEVIDLDHLPYLQKRGKDKLVKSKGVEAYIEIKFDMMAEETPNVCVDLASLEHTESPIWLYGLPTIKPDSYIVEIFSMFSSRLKAFMTKYPIKMLGEEHQGKKNPCYLIPRYDFKNAYDSEGPIVNHFHTLTYETKPRELLPF